MENLIVANWKMNPSTKKEAVEIFKGIKNGVGDVKSEVVVCPPYVHIDIATSDVAIKLGAQNCFWEDKGAFTGEISAAMLKDLGVKYVIIGHSERRKYFAETDEIINKKIKKALEVGLKVIFCIGETAEERDAGKKNEILEHQLKIGLKEIENWKLIIENLVIAYEPVWAIGTGNNCDTTEAKEALEFIRKNIPAEVRILYGGSVKSENSGAYIKEAGYSGLLVGGASLKTDEFIKIVKSAE